MSSMTRRGTQRSLQSLLLKRFAMAFATYVMMALVCWFAVINGHSLGTISTAAWLSLGVFGSQLVFLWLFLSGRNLRYDDPSLTEAQVLVALAWQPLVLAQFDSARGVMMIFYMLILLFGVFQLTPKVFVRCAIFAFFGFAAMLLFEAYRMPMLDSSMAWLQVWVLFILLVWLCLFSSYVQAMRKRMRQRRFALQAHQDTLRGMMRQLEDLVATDELTGLFNRRHFLRVATRELEHTAPGGQHGLALIDLDHFKRINDAHGHAAGDRVLQTFAAVARACLRDGDIIARYGGEEFVLLLPNTDADQFTACCERLREAFAKAEPVGVKLENLSLSAGMTLLVAGDDLDEALQRADQALYQAKRGGRNRCDASWERAGA
ncbi:GGDEF domain-containing protein [Ectopseudomonas oleovorans]|uniref:diguanylate cyclase n=1 Tax=Ectopseudomonas oleovorans TaxID=301 RepID=A0AB35KXZ7_ECTOL|nr:GGDEF domain-containing protein [Pseudomonas oleovorans]MBN7116881.1 DeoR family transcriptional regulator [Pseudomonas oleovorans]MBN7132207.1 DeoR family transcriptional regulator [Pseudomonas oleovorans]MBN7139487.1 DeoR family transcriptional regulator [Pseudomonas oleovorans]MCR1826341.1 GGDEF domain-containing protein [Pseudomonas oleovorans]MDH0567546.1 GGDEF domain-containing protein [Pseudomonas oleovorans]